MKWPVTRSGDGFLADYHRQYPLGGGQGCSRCALRELSLNTDAVHSLSDVATTVVSCCPADCQDAA